MTYKQTQLKSVFPALGDDERCPMLSEYIISNYKEIEPGRKRPAVIICPGGGYRHVSPREAEPVALKFISCGYSAFVLNYSVAPARYPVQLLELAAAVAYVREKADEYHLDKDKIIVCGFSAGGHLAASLGMLFQEPVIGELGISPEACRPSALILCYPVITSGEYKSKNSFQNLTDGSQQLLEKLSLENAVTNRTPPCFIWHTFDDQTVPVENSLLLGRALAKHKVPFELHIFNHGVHGLSLCNSLTTGFDNKEFINPQCEEWFNLAKNWIDWAICG